LKWFFINASLIWQNIDLRLCFLWQSISNKWWFCHFNCFGKLRAWNLRFFFKFTRQYFLLFSGTFTNAEDFGVLSAGFFENRKVDEICSWIGENVRIFIFVFIFVNLSFINSIWPIKWIIRITHIFLIISRVSLFWFSIFQKDTTFSKLKRPSQSIASRRLSSIWNSGFALTFSPGWTFF
jgi:hypothetical protein